SESSHIERLRATETVATRRRETLAKELDRLRASGEEYRRLCSEQRERIALRDAAQARYKTATERIQSIEQGRGRVDEYEKSLAVLSAELPVRRIRVDETQKIAAEAEQARVTAGAAEEAARMFLRTAQTADRYTRAVAQRAQLSQQLAEFTTAEKEIQ